MSNSFTQKLMFPSDILRFGKHNKKEISFVIKNDKTYFDWLLSEGFVVSDLIKDYANGHDVENEQIIYSVNKKTDTLIFRSVKYYLLPKLKFVRKSDMRKHISDTVIAEYKIEIPFTETVTTRTEYRDYTKFHCDCEEVTIIINTKTYDEIPFKEFLDEKLNIHKLK